MKIKKNYKPLPTKEEFIRYYIEENHSREETISHFNITKHRLNRCVHEYDCIKHPEYQIKPKNKRVEITKEALYRYYVIEDHTYIETVKHFNLGSSSLPRLLNEFNINKREITEGWKFKLDPKEIYNYYILENHSYKETIDYFNIGHSVFYGYYLTKYPELIKPKNLMLENLSKTLIKKYGKTAFPISNQEQKCADLLREVFGEDVIQQYKDETRYPFRCDIYIRSLDLFIECNFNWTHGKHPFNRDNLEDRLLLEYWKSKTSGDDYYSSSIDCWTVKDPLKIETARKNNLNYLMFYSEEEFTNWFNSFIIKYKN